MKKNLKLISGKRIQSPLNNKTRPSTSKVREALMNILNKELAGASWLDLCSGSGAMACEALQKGVKRILAIENDKKTAYLCQQNLFDAANNLNNSIHTEVICKDVTSFLRQGPENKKIKFVQDFPNLEPKFDFVFLDPPYSSNIYKDSQEILLSNKWIKRSSTLICECSSKSVPTIHNGWELNKKKIYGNTSLIFLLPIRH